MSGWLVSGLRFEPGTHRILSRGDDHSTAMLGYTISVISNFFNICKYKNLKGDTPENNSNN
jgi:hypothetical protein